jgi:hypothetical protein
VRPFTTSHEYGRLRARFPGRPDLRERHNRLIEYRNKLFAHNDLTPFRSVIVFTRGTFDDAASAHAERSTLNLAAVRRLRGLFSFQRERLKAHQGRLLARLERLEAWPPATEIRLVENRLGTD